jgi:dynein heavy chain
MNTLLVELKRSMEELQLGLDGALNMSDKMEALARGIATNTVRAQAVACTQQCSLAYSKKTANT